MMPGRAPRGFTVDGSRRQRLKPQGKYRELTLASILGGALVGVVLNVGIVFAGLQIGFTIVGSTVGAILGFGILRGMMRRYRIVGPDETDAAKRAISIDSPLAKALLSKQVDDEVTVVDLMVP